MRRRDFFGAGSNRVTNRQLPLMDVHPFDLWNNLRRAKTNQEKEEILLQLEERALNEPQALTVLTMMCDTQEDQVDFVTRTKIRNAYAQIMAQKTAARSNLVNVALGNMGNKIVPIAFRIGAVEVLAKNNAWKEIEKIAREDGGEAGLKAQELIMAKPPVQDPSQYVQAA